MSDFSFDFEKYKQVLADKESTNNPKAVNRLGYVGLYQLGAPALIDAGLVKKGTTNKGLRNKNNWVGGLSLNKFLANPQLQDKALLLYTNRNQDALMSKGMIDENTPHHEKAGLLAAAHLVGATGAQQALMQGKDVKDANFVKPQDYHKMMSSVFMPMSTGRAEQGKPQSVPADQAVQPNLESPSLLEQGWGNLVANFENIKNNPLLKRFWE